MAKRGVFIEEDFSAWKKLYISSVQSQLKEGMTLNKAPSDSGLFNQDTPEPEYQYIPAPNEKTISQKNAFISFGADRPSTVSSGYGKIGAQRAHRIDLVVGRKSSLVGLEEGTQIDNDFATDAARIYISQLTDIDKNFGLADGIIGSSVGRSGIGIKADGIRIIGREGIKIVTGKGEGFDGLGIDGELNSRGGDIKQPSPPIELIAGNNTGSKIVWGGMFNPMESYEYLQPLLLGQNTRDALLELSGIIGEIWAALFTFVKQQSRFNSAVGKAMILRGPPRAVARQAVGALATKANLLLKIKSKNPLYHSRINKIMWEVNYLQPYGYKFICSRNVFTT
jgi:hypothetical protein